MTDEKIMQLSHLSGVEEVLCHEPMSKHTSFCVGGNADLLVRVNSLVGLQNVLAVLKEQNIPYFLLGRGTNLLVGDRGYAGCILTMTAKDHKEKIPAQDKGKDETVSLRGFQVKGTMLKAGAGESIAALCCVAREYGLSGLEFASGIPGTLGGAIAMNAGAYGGSMDQIVESATLLMPDETIQTMRGEELQFGYRKSILQDIPAIVLQATLRLKEGNSSEIAAKMQELGIRRREKQPLEYPSAGSTFKRPKGNFAGKLIMEAGLSGYTIGGAQVSEKHCGFIINKGHATAGDIRSLVSFVRKKVYEDSGIVLEEEIISLGGF